MYIAAERGLRCANLLLNLCADLPTIDSVNFQSWQPHRTIALLEQIDYNFSMEEIRRLNLLAKEQADTNN
jgi:hypothetical protein